MPMVTCGAQTLGVRMEEYLSVCMREYRSNFFILLRLPTKIGNAPWYEKSSKKAYIILFYNTVMQELSLLRLYIHLICVSSSV